MTEGSLNDFLMRTVSKEKWERIATQRRAGLLVPLFSVYSKASTGIGDLGDLRLLIDWACITGNSILQLLPMNEVGAFFCPYDSITSFALEPMYASIEAIPACSKAPLRAKVENLRREFPLHKARHVDYRIKQEKSALLWEIFSHEKKSHSAKCKKFIEENAYWLTDFALFKTLKAFHQGRPWFQWQEQYKNRQRQEIADFTATHQEEIDFQMWVQWLLFSQFKEARKYAKERGVLLKGDLPILAAFDSADVWAHPEFFKLEFAAGAPPDMYCERGQRWGTPTYHWDRIAEDGYTYVKEKLKYAEHFYDILRVDHVVGLFRIWSINYNEPQEHKGFNGFFDPYDEGQWGSHGRKLLSVMLENTAMLLCGEDLGVIPPVCTQTLQEFGIPGNDVQRWVKDWNVRHDFLEPQEYREVSVSMLSTHDTTTWAGWWENEAGTVDEQLFIRKCRERGIDYEAVKERLFDSDRCRHGRLRWKESVDSVEMFVGLLGKRSEEVMDFIDMYQNSYREKEKLWRHLRLTGPMREKADARIIAAAHKVALDSRSIFCIQLIIDWLSLTDILKGNPYHYRINTPGTVSPQNWSLLMPIALDELLKDTLCARMKSMINHSQR